MLTKSDIEFIQENREEVVQNRTVSLLLHHKVENGVDPFTGDPSYDEELETVEATWREYFSQSPGTDDRTIVEGTTADVGDAFAEFELDVDLSDVFKVTHVDSDDTWIIRGIDVLGLGSPNRYYVLLGREY